MLLQYLSAEITSIKKCAECYSNAINYPTKWFTMVCEYPHLVLWAKVKGFNFWPAKLMSIDGQSINVRFFGDHTNAAVSDKNCYFFSEEKPMKARNTSQAYKNAMKVSRFLFNAMTEFLFCEIFFYF